MKRFSGFPARMRFTPVPNLLFSSIIPQMDDLAELKTTLHIFWRLYHKRGYPRFVTYKELAADGTLMGGLRDVASSPAEVLRRALKGAEERGTILHLAFEQEDLYLLNTESDRRAAAKLESGEIPLGGLLPKGEPCVEAEEQPNIFVLYEQNIGMLTPMIAEELREAERLYPAPWIESAFKEAVALNKRSWRYIARILERWSREGRDDGKPGRHSKGEIDPEKYFQGRYGHVVRR